MHNWRRCGGTRDSSEESSVLVAVGHHPKTGEGHQDSACCSQVPCSSPAQPPAVFTASIGAGTEHQSLAAWAAFFFWSVLPSAAVCSSHSLTLKCSLKGKRRGLCQRLSKSPALTTLCCSQLCAEGRGLLCDGGTSQHCAVLPPGWNRAVPTKHPSWLCPRAGSSKVQHSAHE